MLGGATDHWKTLTPNSSIADANCSKRQRKRASSTVDYRIDSKL